MVKLQWEEGIDRSDWVQIGEDEFFVGTAAFGRVDVVQRGMGTVHVQNIFNEEAQAIVDSKKSVHEQMVEWGEYVLNHMICKCSECQTLTVVSDGNVCINCQTSQKPFAEYFGKEGEDVRPDWLKEKEKLIPQITKIIEMNSKRKNHLH